MKKVAIIIDVNIFLLLHVFGVFLNLTMPKKSMLTCLDCICVAPAVSSKHLEFQVIEIR